MRKFEFVNCCIIYFDGITWLERGSEITVHNPTGVSEILYRSDLTNGDTTMQMVDIFKEG